MQLSDKRLAANRANALKSTGPQTPSARRNSSQNAIKHGLFAKAVVLDGESLGNFNKLLKSLHNEFRPTTPTECLFVEKMASAQWRGLRLLTLETVSINYEMSRQTGSVADENRPTRAMLAMRSWGDNSRQADLNSRNSNRLDREHRQALQSLLKLREKTQVQKDATLSEENKEPTL